MTTDPASDLGLGLDPGSGPNPGLRPGHGHRPRTWSSIKPRTFSRLPCTVCCVLLTVCCKLSRMRQPRRRQSRRTPKRQPQRRQPRKRQRRQPRMRQPRTKQPRMRQPQMGQLRRSSHPTTLKTIIVRTNILGLGAPDKNSASTGGPAAGFPLQRYAWPGLDHG